MITRWCPKCRSILTEISIGYKCEYCNSYFDSELWEIVPKKDFEFVAKTEKISVVRCKDCKHYLIMPNCFLHDGSPKHFCSVDGGLSMNCLRDNSFCSFGEKRDD